MKMFESSKLIFDIFWSIYCNGLFSKTLCGEGIKAVNPAGPDERKVQLQTLGRSAYFKKDNPC